MHGDSRRKYEARRFVKGSADTSKWPQGAQNTHAEARVIDLQELATFVVHSARVTAAMAARPRSAQSIRGKVFLQTCFNS